MTVSYMNEWSQNLVSISHGTGSSEALMRRGDHDVGKSCKAKQSVSRNRYSRWIGLSDLYTSELHECESIDI